MVATRKSLTRAKIADEAEQDRCLNSGIGYHLRHTVSGRWYCGRGRYSSDRPRLSPAAAMRGVQWEATSVRPRAPSWKWCRSA